MFLFINLEYVVPPKPHLISNKYNLFFGIKTLIMIFTLAGLIDCRHLTYLLHTLFDHLTTLERTEVAGVLESYTSKCEGSAQPLALDSGVILPPVPFTRFPTIKYIYSTLFSHFL